MVELILRYWSVWGLLVLALVVLVAARLLSRQRAFPYRTRPALLTPAEQHFYRSLVAAVADRWDIFAMVRLADLIQVQRGAHRRQSWQNRINAKHIDFVLCDPQSLQPGLAIELDDRSHQRPERIERDRFVDQALEAAGLPLLRVPVRRTYSVRQLRQAIERKTGHRRDQGVAKASSRKRRTAQA